ncbi:MAG: phosphate/phosphite/phosphonate ABC transporter substrate-binding protein [Anaerolineae bacterium]|nr:phosphate/phosphite/phosphonate ABC transporter substrate-binding protein [Anaerolineae bacterium]
MRGWIGVCIVLGMSLMLVQCSPQQVLNASAPRATLVMATNYPVGARPTVPPRATIVAPLGSVANPVKFAAAPQIEAARTEKNAENVGRLLDQITGLKFQISVPMNYATVASALETQQVDMALLSPTLYIVARERYGAEALLTATRGGSKVYPWCIIVRADSAIHQLRDLRGKRLASPDPLSTSGNIFPRAYLIERQIIPEQDVIWTYSGGHDRAIIALMKGEVDAAAVYGEDPGRKDARELVKTIYPDVYDKTRVLFNSASENIFIPNTTITVRRGLPADVKDKIRDGLLQLVKTASGRAEMSGLLAITGLDIVEPKDYDMIQTAAETAGIDLADELAPAVLRPVVSPTPTAPPARTPRP